MTIVEAFSVATAVFSISLAIFAIWFAVQQRKESQTNYQDTKDVLGKIEKVMEKTELLVSQNFQNLLQNVTQQQNKMLESVLTPRPTQQERILDLFIQLATQEPEKLDSVVNAMSKLTQQEQQRDSTNPLLELLKLGQQVQNQNAE